MWTLTCTLVSAVARSHFSIGAIPLPHSSYCPAAIEVGVGLPAIPIHILADAIALGNLQSHHHVTDNVRLLILLLVAV